MILDSTADFYLLDNLEPLTLQVAGFADLQIPAAATMPAEYAEPDPAGGNVLEGDKFFAWPQNASPRPRWATRSLTAMAMSGRSWRWRPKAA